MIFCYQSEQTSEICNTFLLKGLRVTGLHLGDHIPDRALPIILSFLEHFQDTVLFDESYINIYQFFFFLLGI